MSTAAVTPIELSHSATIVPSCSQARLLYPPPGQTTIATPVFFSGDGRLMVNVGFDTLVMLVTTSLFFFLVSFSGSIGAVSPGGGGGPEVDDRGRRGVGGQGGDGDEKAERKSRGQAVIDPHRGRLLEGGTGKNVRGKIMF